MKPEYVWSLFSRTDWEANQTDILTAQATLIQKRAFFTEDDFNNVLHQYNFTAEKDGQDYCLFGYAVCKIGDEILPDDWSDYVSACGVGQHITGEYGLSDIQDLWGFGFKAGTLENPAQSWYTDPIPFIQDNKQHDKKGEGFQIIYEQNENDYSDTDKSAILNNILKIEDTAENRAMVDSQFNKTEYVYSLDTNIAIYVWSVKWQDYPNVSRKDCKNAEKAGSANAVCELFRQTDLGKVMDRYKIKDKKDK